MLRGVRPALPGEAEECHVVSFLSSLALREHLNDGDGLDWLLGGEGEEDYTHYIKSRGKVLALHASTVSELLIVITPFKGHLCLVQLLRSLVRNNGICRTSREKELHHRFCSSSPRSSPTTTFFLPRLENQRRLIL